LTQFFKSMGLYLGYKRREYLKNAFQDQKNLLQGFPAHPIFDIGAHYGETTAKYMKLFPGRSIYSFEPLPTSYAKLKSRYSKSPLVNPVQMAVSNNVGVKDFYSNVDSATNSLLAVTDEAGQWSDTPDSVNLSARIKVNVTTVDDFCRNEKIDNIGILKMDMQGGELAALEGSKEMLKANSIALVYTELLFVPLYIGQSDFSTIYDLLAGFGYRLFALYNFAYSPGGQLKWCDGLFASPHIASKF